MAYPLIAGYAGRYAWERGLPLRRPPWFGAWSLIIPVVQWWFPYRATIDLLPADHTGRRLVARWWTLWIATGILQVAASVAALLGGRMPFVVVLATVAAVLALLVGDYLQPSDERVLAKAPELDDPDDIEEDFDEDEVNNRDDEY